MILSDIIRHLEAFAPRSYQESYDNSGLIVGEPNTPLTGVLISLDCTEEVVEEAIQKGANLIVSHHPIVFKGLKKFNGNNYVERTVIKAIKNDIALYAIHTNLDNVKNGVSYHIASKLKLQKETVKTLAPKKQRSKVLTTYVPKRYYKEVTEALYVAGAGKIGDYQKCSFKLEGTGTFLPMEDANPFVGQTGKVEEVEEIKVEMVFPDYLERSVVRALRSAHPYEEPAFYIFLLENTNDDIGSGVIGALPTAMEPMAFLQHLKECMGLEVLKYTPLVKDKIKKVALCGGSGSFLIGTAKAQGADIFITGDIKYHDFFDAENQIILVDIGHYESEIYTNDLLHDLLVQEFGDVDIYLSKINTNPVSFLY